MVKGVNKKVETMDTSMSGQKKMSFFCRDDMTRSVAQVGVVEGVAMDYILLETGCQCPTNIFPSTTAQGLHSPLVIVYASAPSLSSLSFLSTFFIVFFYTIFHVLHLDAFILSFSFFYTTDDLFEPLRPRVHMNR